MARHPDTGPPYNFTDRVPLGQRQDRNGWYFRPEPRSFHIVARYGGFMYVTQKLKCEDYTVWFYDLIIAQGSWSHVCTVLREWSGPGVIDTKGD